MMMTMWIPMDESRVKRGSSRHGGWMTRVRSTLCLILVPDLDVCVCVRTFIFGSTETAKAQKCHPSIHEESSVHDIQRAC